MNAKSWIKAIMVIAVGAVLEAILFKYGYGKVAIVIFGLTIIVATIPVLNTCLPRLTS